MLAGPAQIEVGGRRGVEINQVDQDVRVIDNKVLENKLVSVSRKRIG